MATVLGIIGPNLITSNSVNKKSKIIKYNKLKLNVNVT